MMYITRRERFNAAHRLFRADYSEEKNQEVFGPCSNPNWHGHNYELWVTVKGEINEETGFVINLKVLSRILREKIISKVDHKNINIEVPFMKGRIASSENIVKAIWEELEELIKSYGASLHRIRLSETENNFVEYYG